MEGFSPFDVVVVVLLAGMTLRGGLSGVTAQIASLASWGLSAVVAYRYYDRVEALFTMDDAWKKPLSMLILFVGSSLAIHWGTRFFQKMIAKTILKEFDRQMGAILGFVKGAILCLIATFFCVTLSDTTRTAVQNSSCGRYLVLGVAAVGQYIPDDEKHAFIKDAIDKFDGTANELGMATDVASLKDDIADVEKNLKGVLLTESEKKRAIADEEEKKNDDSKTSIFDKIFSLIDPSRSDAKDETNFFDLSDSQGLIDSAHEVLKTSNLTNGSATQSPTSITEGLDSLRPEASQKLTDKIDQISSNYSLSARANNSPDRSKQNSDGSFSFDVPIDANDSTINFGDDPTSSDPFFSPQNNFRPKNADESSRQFITGSYRDSLIFPANDTLPEF